MPQALFAAANWLHALATVVFVGHYLLLPLIYLPVLTKERADGAGLALLSEISKRSRFWLYGALIAFAITGIYLMVIDPGYRGLGDFGNLWSVLMLIKHALILVMIGLGFWFNAILRVGPLLVSKSPPVSGFRRQAYLMAIIGVLVLLLTAAAQAL
jgi:uncharacterized membrane protein